MAYTAFSVAQDEIPNETKWNTLSTNDAHFYSFLGDNLEWQSWTPTWANITVGSGTTTAYYARVGNTIFCRVHFLLSGTTMTSTPSLTLPITAHTEMGTIQHVVGSAWFVDPGTGTYFGSCRVQNSTTALIIPTETVTGNYMNNGGITTTTPFTWANGDYFSATFFYEAA